jgi:hypothetical protein
MLYLTPHVRYVRWHHEVERGDGEARNQELRAVLRSATFRPAPTATIRETHPHH